MTMNVKVEINGDKATLAMSGRFDFNPNYPLAIFREFEASCELLPWYWGDAGSNGYH